MQQQLSQSKSKSKSKVKRQVKSQKDLEWLYSASPSPPQIQLASNQKLRIQFQNSILDCDIVESNSSKQVHK